jgi:hypothetical protein
MTGFESKRQAAQNKMNDDADTLSIVYQRGFADGKRAAQPEQEPVAWMVKLGDVTCFQHHADSKHASVPLYTTPPAAQPEQEPCIGKDPRCPCQDGDACHYKDCGNTKARPVPPAQPEQEPVAWAVQGCSKMWRDEFAEIDAKAEAKRIGGTCVAYALYTAPPAAQRPWQGLTDEDRRKFAAAQYGWEDLLIAAEAKLKERNGY